MRRLPVSLLLGLLAVAQVPAALALGGESHAVEMRDLAFAPPTITIRAGDSVTWTNTDGVEHTATSAPSAPVAFDTGLLGTGQTATVTFDKPGSYLYLCTPHPFMTGAVIVEASEGGPLPDAAMRSTAARGTAAAGAPSADVGAIWTALAILLVAVAWSVNARQRRSR